MSDVNPQDGELARVRELAVAFALSEIDDAGRQELYALLTGTRGAEMAKAAWEQLDGTVDLRVQLGGPAFAEAVRLKLNDDGSFARAARRRLGNRPLLDPVDVPPPKAGRWTRRLTWFLAPMVLAAVITALVLRSQPPATVTAVSGLPVASGMALVPGVGLDAGSAVAVPPGAALAWTWRDGSTVVIAGPASAVAQPAGLSLVGGTAWCVANAAGLTIGTPDRRLRLPPGARVAVSVSEGSTAVAVPEGAPGFAEAPAPGRLSAFGSDGAWAAKRPVTGVVALPGPWWELEVVVGSWEGERRLRLGLDPGPTLVLAPTTLTLAEGRVAQLSGAPADIRHLLLRVRGRRADITIDGGEPHAIQLSAVPTALRIERAGALGAEAELRIGPSQQPVLPLAGW